MSNEREYRQEQEQIKRAIVSGYRRGLCTAVGGDIPIAKRGSAGKGSRFRPAPSVAWYENFDRIDWSGVKGS